MAQYFEDFRDAVLDSVPTDFSLVWGGPIAFAIKSGNPLTDSDKHLLLTPSDGGFVRTAIKWLSENTSGRTTVRVLLQCQFQNELSQAVHIPGPFLSGSGNSASRTGYVFWAGGSDRISKYNGGSDSTLATGSTSGSVGLADRWLEIIRDGTTIEVRRWLFGEERPVTANVEVADGSPLAVAGFFGLSFLSSTANTPGKLYSIAAATDGDAVPTAPVGGGVTIDPDTATSSVTAFDPVVSTGASVSPDVALSTMEGFDPAVVTGASVLPDAGETTTQAYDPTVAAGATQIDPDVATSEMRAYDPTVAAGAITIDPDVAISTMLAYDPTVSAGGSVYPDFAITTMEGFDPVVVTGASVFPDTAETVMEALDPVFGEPFIRRVALPGLYVKSVIL